MGALSYKPTRTVRKLANALRELSQSDLGELSLGHTLADDVKNIPVQGARTDSEIKKAKREARQLIGRASDSGTVRDLERKIETVDRKLINSLSQLSRNTSDQADAKEETARIARNALALKRKEESDNLQSRQREQILAEESACIGYVFRGNVELNGDDHAGLSAEALNDAASGAPQADAALSFPIQANQGTVDAPSHVNHVGWDDGLHPKITTSKGTVVDGDVGAPLYRMSGSPVTAIAGTITWDTTTTVLMDDTTGVVAGMAIRKDDDGILFEVVSVVEDTSVLIKNPHGHSIPTGAGASSVSDLPVFDSKGWLKLTLSLDVDAGATKNYVDAEKVDATVSIATITKPLDFSDVADKTLDVPIIA